MLKNLRNNDLEKKIKSALLGVAVGDALGVPVEFQSRAYLKAHPVSGMTGHGTWNKPAGTWSDDSSLTFCLAESLIGGFDLQDLGMRFKHWLFEGYWTADGETFDVGNTTKEAIIRMEGGISPEVAGGTEEHANGNGSLMRILPLLFYVKGEEISDRFEKTAAVSAITHAHIRSVIACFYYLEFARVLLKGEDKKVAYKNLRNSLPGFLTEHVYEPAEITLFDSLLKGDIYRLSETEIRSGGYVLHSLEAAIWCLMTTGNYKEAVLKAINLGEDTDTVGSITGGLAGLYYGYKDIPREWLQLLARKKNIEYLSERLAKKLTYS